MNAERLLANYEKIADAPDAIERLRRFILDLAVRGKLVPQEPNDEPAEELLKRIGNEKERLGLDNVLPPIKSDEAPFELPIGWSWSRIGEICSKTGSGSTPRGGKEVYEPSGIPFLRSQNVYDDGLRLSDVVYIAPATHERMRGTHVAPGDLLLNITGGSMGRCCLVPSDFREANISQHVAIIRVALPGLEAFLHKLVLSPYFQAFIFGEQTGAGRGGLPKNRMDLIAVAVPPLAEQYRIVAKVDELMGLCDRLEVARGSREAARDRLAAASLARLNAPDPETFQADSRFVLDALPAITTRPDQIKQLRETILNLAVCGKLVPQDALDEPASVLLKRLEKAQVAACLSEELRMRAPVAKLSRSEMWFDFPEHWSLSSFNELFVIVSGVTKGQRIAANEAVEAPYLRVANVQRGHLDLSVIKTITVRKAEVERYTLRLGDVLMTEGGDWDKLGRAAIWREEIPHCIHQNHIFRVRPPSEDVLSEWVITYVNSRLGRTFFEDASKQTTNLASINMTQLRGLPFPLPPLAEQHRIAAKVNSLMALCDRLESSLSATAATRRRLLDALLAVALAPVDARELEAAE